MGEARRRGTYEQRAALATEMATAAASAKRQKHFDEAKARMKLEREAVERKTARAPVVRDGRRRTGHELLAVAALMAMATSR